MDLKQYRYSVLAVSASAKFNQSISALLQPSLFGEVTMTGMCNQARRLIAERQFDIVIINTPLPDDFGIRLASDLAADWGCSVLMFVKNDLYDGISEKLFGQGIFILPKPTSGTLISQTLQLLCAACAKTRHLERKNATLEEKMEEIRLVNRAKWVLISELKMTEAEAHRYIEKTAMDLCLTRREVAGRIIQTYQ